MNYLDLLPYDIITLIDNFVLELYRQEQRETKNT